MSNVTHAGATYDATQATRVFVPGALMAALAPSSVSTQRSLPRKCTQLRLLASSMPAWNSDHRSSSCSLVCTAASATATTSLCGVAASTRAIASAALAAFIACAGGADTVAVDFGVAGTSTRTASDCDGASCACADADAGSPGIE